MMCQSSDMIVISEDRFNEQIPVPSMLPEEETYPPVVTTPSEGIRDMEIEAFETFEISSYRIGVAEFTASEEKARALEVPISSNWVTQILVREEHLRASEQFSTLSEAIGGPGSICSMESEASPAPSSSSGAAPFTGRVEGTRASEQIATLLNVMGEVIEGLENYCLLEGMSGVETQRSPLPLWYPRRPLQDITAVINNCPVRDTDDASIFKKSIKKSPTVHLHQHAHDNRGAFGQPRTVRVPFKPTSSVSAASKRSSLLRKGFR